MKDFFVADAARFENQFVISFFAVASKQMRNRKDGGGQYVALWLGDRTGQIEARMWENFDESVREYAQGDIVKVRAEVCRYNGKLQFTIDKLRRALDHEIDLADYLPHTTKNVDEMWAELGRYVASFTDPHLQALVRAFLDDPAIGAALREAPAAKSLHHAWLGGLLEHIVSLLGICDLAARHYPEVHRDLVLTGVVLHDIGKLEELRWGTTLGYTLRGQMVGHISIAMGMLQEKIAGIPGFPDSLRMLVEHMVLSHHGRYEFGSPKLPMIPEAVLLHYLDDLDAKMHTMRGEFARHAAAGRDPGELTEWVRAMDRPLLNTAAFLSGADADTVADVLPGELPVDVTVEVPVEPRADEDDPVSA